MNHFWLYLEVLLASAIKFVAGILIGGAKLTIWETTLLSTLGMMITVVLVTFVGENVRDWWLKRTAKKGKIRKKFTKKNRFIVRVRSKWGIYGIAFLTPLLFSPPVGAILAVSIKAARLKIYYTMAISGILWGLLMSFMYDELIILIDLMFGKE